MKEYLVKNHEYGGYYISDGDPEIIEEVCEQCGDYDEILASWEKGNDEEQIEAILPRCYSEAYINEVSENDEEVFKNWLIESGYNKWEFSIQNDITETFSRARDIVNSLEGISDYVAGRLRGEIAVREIYWREFTIGFDFSQLQLSREKTLSKKI